MTGRKLKPETKVQATIIDALKLAFPRARVLRTNSGTIVKADRVVRLLPKGFPDTLVLLPGRLPCVLETKTEEGSASPAQLDWRAWFESAGYVHAFVRSAPEAIAAVRAANDNGAVMPRRREAK